MDTSRQKVHGSTTATLDDDYPGSLLHPLWMEVDLGKLEKNFFRIRQLVTRAKKIIASVKANAYGHGIVAVGHTLERLGAHGLATGSLPDAIRLRRAGIRVPILIFGRCLPSAYPELLSHRLIPTIHAPGQAEALNDVAGQQRIPAYIKVDAGLGRLGFPITDAEQAILTMARLPYVAFIGLYTHLPFSQDTQRDITERNLERFAHLVQRLSAQGLEFEVVQANASSGILSGLPDQFNAVCPGHALYGLEPSAFPLAKSKGFEPVLQAVRTRLIQVGERSNEVVRSTLGYGESAAVRRRGIVPVGQAEGLSSNGARNGQVALVRGTPVPLLSASFEHAVLDISGLDDCHPGDVVTLLGEDGAESITLEQFANWRGGSMKDALMALSGRMTQIYQ